MSKITCWEEVIAEDIARIDFCCFKCRHINVLVKGENLNCEKCGEPLIKFASQEVLE